MIFLTLCAVSWGQKFVITVEHDVCITEQSRSY